MMLIRSQRHVALALLLALLVAGCARRVVVDSSNEPVEGWRVNLALALNDVSAGLLDWSDAVESLAVDGQLTPERADAIRTANGQVAEAGQTLNDALRDAADDQTVLDSVRTVQSALIDVMVLVPDDSPGRIALNVLVEAVNIMLEIALAIEVQP
jgi:hypothetical protein